MNNSAVEPSTRTQSGTSELWLVMPRSPLVLVEKMISRSMVDISVIGRRRLNQSTSGRSARLACDPRVNPVYSLLHDEPDCHDEQRRENTAVGEVVVEEVWDCDRGSCFRSRYR